MGGNEIILLYGDQVGDNQEVSTALFVLDPPYVGGHQAGLLWMSSDEAAIRVRIVDVTARDFITMCGGLTQVTGRALMETNLAKELGLEFGKLTGKVTLETDLGPVPLILEENDGGFGRVLTGMGAFVEECYQLGVESVSLAGVEAMRVGKFMVVRTDDILRVYPEAKFCGLDRTTKEILIDIQKDFDSRKFVKNINADFTLYDLDPKVSQNTGRLIFPHRVSSGHIEPACGTGTVACGIAMVEKSEISSEKSPVKLLFESGGDQNSIGGPDLTELKLTISDGVVTEAYFSHSLVEILATGRVRL